jgi:hypothetical protein
MLSSQLAEVLATRINFRDDHRSSLEDYFSIACYHALAKNPSASRRHVNDMLGLGSSRVPASAETMYWLLRTHVLDRAQRDHFFANERRPTVWIDFLKTQRVTARDIERMMALPLQFTVFAYVAAHPQRFRLDSNPRREAIIDRAGAQAQLVRLATSNPGEYLGVAEQWLKNIAKLRRLDGGYKLGQGYRSGSLPTVKLLVVEARPDLHDLLRELRSPGFVPPKPGDSTHFWHDSPRLRRELTKDLCEADARRARVRQRESRERRPTNHPLDIVFRKGVRTRSVEKFTEQLFPRDIASQSMPADEWLADQLGNDPATWVTFFGLFDGWALTMRELIETARILTKSSAEKVMAQAKV